MRLIASLPVPGRPGKSIELVQGDLTVPDPRHPFQLLVVSAFPGDYMPTPGSLIGALAERGVRVADLARAKAIDLRTHFSCWLSRDVSGAGLGFDRILCFEPLVRGSPPEVVGDIFRALMPILGDHAGLRRLAMPVVAAGDQAWPLAAILPPLLDAALHWMAIGLPLDVIKIAVHSDAQAEQATPAFEAFGAAHGLAPAAAPPGAARYDVFLSYAREDSRHVDLFEAQLRSRAPGTRVFLDRREIGIGAAWQPEIFESIDRSRRVVAMLSPAYLASKVCKEEFNIAWARSRETGRDLLFPVYLYSAELPTYMTARNYADCREGSAPRLGAACESLADALRRDP